jgi:hypothetical protein
MKHHYFLGSTGGLGRSGGLGGGSLSPGVFGIGSAISINSFITIL